MDIFYKVEVRDTDKTRHYWADRKQLSEATKNMLSEADVFVLPWDHIEEGKEYYPDSTTEFFKGLISNNSGIQFSLVVDPHDYREISLHSKRIRWPTMHVMTVSLGVLSSLLASQIEKHANERLDETILETSLIIEDADGKCIEFRYVGPPNELVTELLKNAARCFPKEEIDKDATYIARRINEAHSDR